MARIKFGMMMTDARGKLGGQVFSKNRAGAYIRTKVTPTNKQTTAQTLARVLFGAISAGWSALSGSSRAGWNEAVPEWATTDIFGDLKNPTGKELYQRLNNQAQSAGYPAVTSIPAKLALPGDVVSVAEIAIGAGTITLTGASASVAARSVYTATAQLTQGTKFVKNRLRQIYTSVSSTTSPSDAYAAYVAKFGIPKLGDNIVIGLKYVNASGQATPVQTIKATIVA